ncbi:MAG: hypothetical protein ABI895_09390 [Deltaproteobacteria bacterium]
MRLDFRSWLLIAWPCIVLGGHGCGGPPEPQNPSSAKPSGATAGDKTVCDGFKEETAGGTEAAVAAKAADDGTAPAPCTGPFEPTTSKDCKSHGWHLLVAENMCTDECDPASLTTAGECCGDDPAQGATCAFSTPETGSTSVPNPCPSSRRFYVCNGVGTCRCSKHP